MLKKELHIKEQETDITKGYVRRLYIPYEEGQRLAQCYTCGLHSLSDKILPMFREKHDQQMDQYYCGCQGWD